MKDLLYSNEILVRYSRLNTELSLSSLGNEENLSDEAIEFLEIEKRVTASLLYEVIKEVNLGSGYSISLEIESSVYHPFKYVIESPTGDEIRGKPLFKYKFKISIEDYIKREIEEVHELADNLKEISNQN